MKRLDTILPEWTRFAWASAAAEKVWQERLHNINLAWSRIERWSVVEGARGSCLTFCEPKDLPELVRWGASCSVRVLPMTQVGILEQYSASPAPPTANQNWQYRVVMCRTDHQDAWFEVWNNGETNDDLIGKMLGFPECCRDFFHEYWVEQKFLDTSWPMAANSYALLAASRAEKEVGRDIELKGHDDCNILLRWLGVRAVAHLPCSFHCEATRQSAAMFAQVAQDKHFDKQWAHIREMLAWPVEWSALHGIAEIKTPVLKISSRTDMTEDKYTVRRLGDGYPAEGVDGLVFPYRTKADQVKLSETPAFKRAFPAAQEQQVEINIHAIDAKSAVAALEAGANAAVQHLGRTDLWKDNGFSTLEAMNAAHAVVLEAASEAGLAQEDKVLDLGCGNAWLLERLAQDDIGLWMWGIEHKAERCGRAGERLRAGEIEDIIVYEGSIFDSDLWSEEIYDLVFFMPGRLTEFTIGRAKRQADGLRKLLRERAKQVVFYAYGDWLKEGGLPELMEKVKLDEDWERVGGVIETPNATAWLAAPRVRPPVTGRHFETAICDDLKEEK